MLVFFLSTFFAALKKDRKWRSRKFATLQSKSMIFVKLRNFFEFLKISKLSFFQSNLASKCLALFLYFSSSPCMCVRLFQSQCSGLRARETGPLCPDGAPSPQSLHRRPPLGSRLAAMDAGKSNNFNFSAQIRYKKSGPISFKGGFSLCLKQIVAGFS